jgi:molecular chaperone DnaJ
MEQLFKDTEVKVKLRKKESCSVCGGTGAKPGTKASTCSTCDGAGVVRQTQGFFSLQTTCPRCRGTGKTISSPCSSCGGSGFEERQKTITVKIPAGIEDGSRIRIPGEGEAGENGSASGDLFVVVNVNPNKFYERHGSDLYCKIPISMTLAALGGQIEITSLDGRTVSVKVPAGTQEGRILRLNNMGLPHFRSSGRGDLNAIVTIQIPQNLSGKAKNLLEEFSKLQKEPSNIAPLPLH